MTTPQKTPKASPQTTEAPDPRNVEVKALRPHCNSHGDKFQKEKDDTYVHPYPAADIKAGVVELVAKDAKAG